MCSIRNLPTSPECQEVPQARMWRRSILRDLLVGHLDRVEEDAGVLEVHAAGEGVLHGLGLLVDLLEHEVLVAALLRLDGVPVEAVDRALDRLALAVPDLDAFRGEPRDVAVLQEADVLGVDEERRRIGGQELLALAEADHQRRALAGGDDLLAVGLGGHHGEGVHPFELTDGAGHGSAQVAIVQVGGDQIRHHLGVGVRVEGPPLGQEALLERQEVLDDAVVDQRQPARASRPWDGRCARSARRGWPSGCGRGRSGP